MRTIAVLGPGGVGGFLAAALARAGHDVTVVAREPTAEVIDRDGISVRSAVLGEFVARPAAVAVLERPVQVLLVAPKATALVQALGRVRSEPELVVPLLNGLEHMSLLRERFGAGPVAAGVIRIESDRPAPGRVVQTSPSARVDLAADDPALRPALESLGSALRAAGIAVEPGESEAQILWSKLVRLCPLACTTSALDQPIGVIRSDSGWRVMLERCVEEASAVANADGAEIDPRARLKELDEAHPELGSSMRRDLAAGREPELDAIAGAVLRAGARHGIDCPTIAGLAARIAERAGITLTRGPAVDA